MLGRALLTDEPGRGTLLLVRHGQQEPWHLRSGPDGRDPALTELGQRQAEATAAYLAAEPVAAVYSSTMRRAVQTAASLAARHELDVQVLTDVHEIEMRRGLPADRMPHEVIDHELLAAAVERFCVTRRWAELPFGEDGDELRQRVTGRLEAVLAAHPAATVVVVCHGGVINAYLAQLLGISSDMWFRPAHASVNRLRFYGTQRVLHRINEIDHLATTDGLLTT
jgi:broad specificity phosphatase PhoE